MKKFAQFAFLAFIATLTFGCVDTSLSHPYPQPNRWECKAGNGGWVGTGTSRHNAANNAISVCSSNTGGAGGCRIKTCFLRAL